MGKARAFSFFVLGVVSLVAQVLLLREALMVFTGNEFFIGWTLCIWLFWTAAGAAATRHGLDLPAVRMSRVAACHLAAAALLPAEVVVLRTARAWLGGGAGAVPDLLPSLGFLLAALAPLCLVLGAQFVFGLRALAAAAAAGAESSQPGAGRMRWRPPVSRRAESASVSPLPRWIRSASPASWDS